MAIEAKMMIVAIARIDGSKSNSMALKTSTGKVVNPVAPRNSDTGTSPNETRNA